VNKTLALLFFWASLASASLYGPQLPTQSGNSGKCLSTNGSGVLSWAACSGGSSGITALTGDVTATGPGSAAATVAKIQGTAVASGMSPSGGQVLTWNGTNSNWDAEAAGSAGANTALSNLASVAINTNLIFGATGSPLGAPATIQTAIQGAGTASDALFLVSGDGNSGNSNSGAVQIQTGAGSGSGPSGNILLQTGNPVNGNSGNISLVVGTPSGSGSLGKIKLNDGSGTIAATQVWTATASDGSGHWAAASGGSPAGSTGDIQFNTSSAFNASSNLFWDNSNNRLGINQSTPTSTLHIVVPSPGGNAIEMDSNTGNGVFFHGSSSGGNGTFKFGAQGGAIYIGAESNNPVNIQTNNANQITISTGGAVQFTAYGQGVAQFDGSGNITATGASTSGNILTSNGSTWVSSAPASGLICGWKDTTIDIDCKGVDPSVSCPSGYTQHVGTTVTFCSAN
jgi:hypothetical protein